MENGTPETTKATRSRRQDQLRVQAFYLRGQLDAAEQTLRNAQRIAYSMFGETVGAQQNGEMLPSFMAPPKKRRRPRSPEAIQRAVATRRANQDARAKSMRDMQKRLSKLSGKSDEKAVKAKSDRVEKPEKAGERVAEHAAA